MASAATLPDDLKYALDLGFPLFPVNSDKRPLVRYTIEASRDERQIAHWLFGQYKGCNIATMTGPESDLLTLDIDSAEGHASLAAYERQNSPLPAMLRVSTGRDGSSCHILGRSQPGRELHNSTWKKGGLARGIDVRAWHGVEVLPPSVHRTGRSYAWLKNPFVQWPDWMYDLVENNWLKRHPRVPEPQPQDVAASPAPFDADQRYHGFRAVNHGERHPALLRSAGKMRRHGASADEITTKLLHENRTRCHPPKSPADVIQLARDVAMRYAPAIGPDPLETAWINLSLCDAAHPRHKIIAIARELATSRQTFLLPQLRLSDLLHVPQPTVSRIIRGLVADHFLDRVGSYEPRESAQHYSLSPLKYP